MAAAAMSAAADQKDMVWLKVGTLPKVAKLGDPMQLFSLGEVLQSEGSGTDAKLTVQVVDAYYNKPIGTDFLPQKGGPADGDKVQVQRGDVMPANPASQEFCMDLGELDNLHEAGLLYCLGQRYCD